MTSPPVRPYDVVHSQRSFTGRVIAVRTDAVHMPDGAVSDRDVIEHPGAVAVVALDEQDRVVLVEQYRHPVQGRLWELPAGLLDVAGESAALGAARELREEAGLVAARWTVLVDALTSPGMTDEAIRIYLARGLTDVGRGPGEHEEADLAVTRVPLEEAVRQILAGELRNAAACIGILAAAQALGMPEGVLRSTSAPWPDRPDRAEASGPTVVG